jgi:hypothetical protein
MWSHGTSGTASVRAGSVLAFRHRFFQNRTAWTPIIHCRFGQLQLRYLYYVPASGRVFQTSSYRHIFVFAQRSADRQRPLFPIAHANDGSKRQANVEITSVRQRYSRTERQYCCSVRSSTSIALLGYTLTRSPGACPWQAPGSGIFRYSPAFDPGCVKTPRMI